MTTVLIMVAVDVPKCRGLVLFYRGWGWGGGLKCFAPQSELSGLRALLRKGP